MPTFHLILVALIQGITEFLPISSSGHLILLPELTGARDQGQLVDVAVHVGTLFAVMLYFRADMALILPGAVRLLRGRADTPGAFLALCLAIATIPAVIAGLALHLTGADALLRSATVIGWTMLIFGLVLLWADRTGDTGRTAENWGLRDAVVMGLWQALALIPGTSRSGITITAARRLGFAREDAARLAMLMSVPVIIASGVVVGVDAVRAADPAAIRDAVFAALLAFGAALLALWAMMHLLRRISFLPYVIYRVALGIALLIYGYSG